MNIASPNQYKQLYIVQFGVGDVDIIWAHGWGQSHEAFIPLASGLQGNVRHLMLDFPGFGASLPPPEPWGTVEYTNLVAEWLGSIPRRKRVWIGHSFGCRIGLRLASRHKGLVDGLFLIAAAGIRPPAPLFKRLIRMIRAQVFSTLKRITLSEDAKERLRERWGSADYRAAGSLRDTFVRVVNEDLSQDARSIQIPVALIYGGRDTETPPIVGKIFHSLLPQSTLTILTPYDHWTVLSEGRFQIQAKIKDFLQQI